MIHFRVYEVAPLIRHCDSIPTTATMRFSHMPLFKRVNIKTEFGNSNFLLDSKLDFCLICHR